MGFLSALSLYICLPFISDCEATKTAPRLITSNLSLILMVSIWKKENIHGVNMCLQTPVKSEVFTNTNKDTTVQWYKTGQINERIYFFMFVASSGFYSFNTHYYVCSLKQLASLLHTFIFLFRIFTIIAKSIWRYLVTL